MKLDDLLPFFVALLTSIPGIIALLQNRKKVLADARKTLADADKVDAEKELTLTGGWSQLNMAYRQEISDLKGQVAALRAEVARLEKKVEDFDDVFVGAHRLYSQLKAHDFDPVYTPPDRRQIDSG